MSKKDYELIAGVLKKYYWETEDLRSTHEVLKEVLDDLIIAFEVDNPRFNYSKFMEACIA